MKIATKNTLLSLTTLLLISVQCFAQNESKNWYFGNNAGIDFNTTPPTALMNNAGTASDYMSAISDANGSLLFYTNGVTIWNKNNQVMSNGTGLLGTTSSGQSPLIIPQPNSNLYYIFTVDQWGNGNGLRVNIVDMTLQSGLGAVTIKNNMVYTPATEKITAFYNATDNYFWIITHAFQSNEFRVYKVDDQGILFFPVVSASGSINGGSAGQFNNAVGELTISSDGTKLINACYGGGFFELFDFDSNTGIVSNPRIINGYPNAFGATFSPDGSKLYVSRWSSDNRIWQYDLSQTTWSQVLNSATQIATVSPNPGYLQLGPDNKIYVAKYNGTSLDVIDNPNNMGNSCTYLSDGFYLNGKSSSAGLCNSIVFQTTTGVENIVAKSQLSVYPNPSTGSININFSGDDYRNLKLFSIEGKLILEKTISKNESNVFLQDLKTGFYSVELKAENGKSVHEKFTVINN